MTTKARKESLLAVARWQDEGPIRKFRKRKRMTVAEFAHLVGCTFTNVSYWEKEGGTPKKHLAAVARAMGTSPERLLYNIRGWAEKRPTR